MSLIVLKRSSNFWVDSVRNLFLLTGIRFPKNNRNVKADSSFDMLFQPFIAYLYQESVTKGC